MRTALSWITAAVVYGFAGAWAEELPAEVLVMQAQKDCGEAQRLLDEGKYPEAIPLGERALEILEKTLGPKHPTVAECRDLLCGLYLRQGDYVKADPLCERAFHIQEATLGPNHPGLVKSLGNLADLYASKGLGQKAKPLYQREYQIQEAAFGENHPEMARSLGRLALFYSSQGLDKEAEPMLQRALQIQEATLGKNHLHVADSLYHLAIIYRALGAYERAKLSAERSLEIREAILGKEHPHTAHLLNALALIHHDQGFYNRAEPLYRRALQIWEQVLGKDHRDVATAANNLASLYQSEGFYDRAQHLYERSLRILETILGERHSDIASLLSNLATLAVDQGDNTRGELLHRRSLEIREAIWGKNHPHVAKSLYRLALLYQAQGLYERAEPFHQRALQIRELVLGVNHPDVARSLDSLALLYQAQGVYERAEPLHHRALQILESSLGGNHPYVADSLNNLARLYLAQNRLASALPLLERAFTISETRLRREALDFSEARLAGFLRLMQRDDETLYNLLRAHPSDMAVRHLALATALLHKGRSLAEIAGTSHVIYRQLDQIGRQQFQHLRALRTQRAELSFRGPGKLSPAAHQARLQELETQADTLEAELAQRSAPLRAQKQLPGPEDVIERVAGGLPQDGALIEIVAFDARPLTPPPGISASKVRSVPAYVAFILLPHGDIHAVDLGPAEPVDIAVGHLCQALASRTEAYQPAAQELYRLVFQPLLPVLGSKRQLFISPDGQLGLVPWAALHDGTRFLMDAFDLTYLISGKELLPRSRDLPSPRSVVVFADPDFDAVNFADASRESEASSSGPSPAERSFISERFFARQHSELSERPWPQLPGARQEAGTIRNLWPEAHLFVGAEATKQALLQTAAPEILHVATHGFFLEDARTSSSTRGVGSTGELADGGRGEMPSDPLLRSGLVMARAHPQSTSTDKVEATRHRLEESLVTALELAGMNLWGTQLVVLSACDTGQGDVKIGQGVYGLRRAFAVAGAETLVTSLWKVDDTTTRELMDNYYRGLQKGQGRAAAMQAAMRGVRARRPHPYDWAPFIVVGNGAPLRGVSPVHP